jgi:hypothetical protein
MYYRIFGSSVQAPEPAALLDHLAGLGLAVTGSFAGDEVGWFRADLTLGAGEPLALERFTSDEEGIRAELNSWAAYLETCTHSPHHGPLMERVIQTRQLFTVRRPDEHPDESASARVCLELCRFLAGATAGFYQIDEQGFFSADGTLLVAER